MDEEVPGIITKEEAKAQELKKQALLEKRGNAKEYIDEADQFLVRAMRWLSLALSIIRFGKEKYDERH